MIKIYTYTLCGTCKKAIKFLKDHSIPFTEIPIRDTPPSTKEIYQMFTAYEDQYPPLFNRSGKDYRDQHLKDRLPDMDHEERVALLASNGNLIKRPFLISESIQRVGFNESEWQQLFKV